MISGWVICRVVNLLIAAEFQDTVYTEAFSAGWGAPHRVLRSWSGSGATVLLEEELTVADGHRAIQFELQWLGGQTTNYLFMEVGERYLELFGAGDLEIFDEIIGTLRFVESGS